MAIIIPNKLEERSHPQLIVRDEGEVYQVEMFHVINIGKKNPEFNFNRYLQELMSEFKYEITRTAHMPPTTSHITVPDPEDLVEKKVMFPMEDSRKK